MQNFYTFCFEMGVIISIVSVKSKLAGLGKTCMFILYANYHKGDKYHMFNITSKTMCLIYDIQLTHKTYAE